MMTPYTKKCKVTRNIFGILSWFLCFGAAAFFIIFAFASGMIGGDGSLVTKMGTVLYSFMLSILPIVTIAVIVKNKVKPLVFTADVIVANVMLPPARRGDMSGVCPSLSRPVGNPSGLKKRTINERQLMEVCNATPPPLL